MEATLCKASNVRPATGPSERVAPLKLSEAIRIGSMLRPKTKGLLYDEYGTCALGAALEAAGFRFLRSSRSWKDERDIDVRSYWPWLSRWTEARIIFRNDFRDHSREQIADWVATIEPK